jgi:putative oxidoreductase
MNTYSGELQMVGVGLLFIRLVVGIVMAAHGAQKLFGWFGGYGLNKTGEFFVQLGFPQGRAFAAAASIAEVTSGALVALGFLGPIGPALMISVMVVAMITVHWKNGLFAASNGIEVPLLYSSVAVGLALIGFGRYSVDALLGIPDPWAPSITFAALGAGVLGGLANAAISRRATTTVRG